MSSQPPAQNAVEERPASQRPHELGLPARQPGLRSWTWLKGAPALISVLALAISAGNSIITTQLLREPNRVDATERQAQIGKIAIEPHVTLARYFQHVGVRSAVKDLRAAYPARTEVLMKENEKSIHRTGAVAHFTYEVKGLKNSDIAWRWTLFDANNGQRIAESEDIDPLPLGVDVQKKDLDVGAWEVWVDTQGRGTGTVFIRLELYDYDSNSEVRLTFADSQAFQTEPPDTPAS